MLAHTQLLLKPVTIMGNTFWACELSLSVMWEVDIMGHNHDMPVGNSHHPFCPSDSLSTHLMFVRQFLLCVPHQCPPFTHLWRTVLDRVSCQAMHPKQTSFRCFSMVSRGSWRHKKAVMELQICFSSVLCRRSGTVSGGISSQMPKSSSPFQSTRFMFCSHTLWWK